MKTITNEQYEQNERIRHHREVQAIESAPLIERKEGAARYAEDLRDPEFIAQRAGWLLNGSYGRGAQIAAEHYATSKRTNQAAGIGLLLAIMEYRTSTKYAIAEYKKLTIDQQNAINAAIMAAIDEYNAENAQ